jgi:hypothetical protein
VNLVGIPKNASTSICSALGVRHKHCKASETPSPRFAVVRHPADRAYSAYRFVQVHHSSDAKRCNACTFAEFLLQDNEFTKPQSWWLDAPVDLLLRFETLAEDFPRYFGIPLPLMNVSKDDTKWDDEGLIYKLYREDFMRFGYHVT